MINPLPVHHARNLAQKLKHRQITLVVGKGVSQLCPRNDGNPSRLPLWDDLSDRIAHSAGLDPDRLGPETDALDIVAQQKGRSFLERLVREACYDHEYDLSHAHRSMEDLPWHEIVTTNLDRLLQRLDGGLLPIFKEPGPAEPTAGEKRRLIHLHGTLDHPGVLTSEDFRGLHRKRPWIRRYLLGELLSRTFLFVGFGFRDPDFTSLLESIGAFAKDQDQRLYAWMREVDQQQVRLLDLEYGIEAVPIEAEEHWQAAFIQLQRMLDTPNSSSSVGGREDDSLAYDRLHYSQAMEDRYGFVDLQPLVLPGYGSVPSEVRLEEVFVEPKLRVYGPSVPEAGRSASGVWSASSMKRSEPPSGFEHAEPQPSDEPQGIRRMRWAELCERYPDWELRWPPDDVLLAEPRLAVLAPPGRGKTALLRHLLLKALRLWRTAPELHPFPVYLELGKWMEQDATVDLRERLRMELPRLTGVDSCTVKVWAQGPVLWLLDGLDEINQPGERERFLQQLQRLPVGRDKWVLTSRASGLPSAGIGPGWTLASLCPLHRDQVEAILEKWAKLLSRREGLELYAIDLYRAIEIEQDLQHLSGNALLLTLAVLFCRSGKGLLQDRWDYFGYCERVLRDTWAQRRLNGKGSRFPGAYLDIFLEQLALWGMENGRATFSENDLAGIAEPILRAHAYSNSDRGQELDALLAACRDLISVTTSRAADRIEFLHAGFQEYFAARALHRRGTSNQETIRRFWDHPDWTFVWSLYALAICDDSFRFEELLGTILANPAPLDRRLQRHWATSLHLAGQASSKEVYRCPSWQPIEKWAIKALGGIGWSLEACFSALESWGRELPTSLLEPLTQLAQEESAVDRDSPIACIAGRTYQALAERFVVESFYEADQYINWEDQWALKVHASRSRVQSLLLRALAEGDPEIRAESACALAPHAAKAVVRNALLDSVSDEVPTVRDAALQSLRLGADDPVVLKVLLQAISNSDSGMRAAAVYALERQSSIPGVQDALLHCLCDPSSSVRQSAILALRERYSEPAVQKAMIDVFGDEDELVQSEAVFFLSLRTLRPELRGRLLLALCDDDALVRYGAALALHDQVARPIVREALLAALSDADPDVRSQAAWSLTNHPPHPLLKRIFMDSLRDGESEIRDASATGLGAYASDPAVTKLLIAALSDTDSGVRAPAAASLASQAGEPEVQAALVAARLDTDEVVRIEALRALSSQVADPKIREAVLSTPSSDEDFVRAEAAEVLASETSRASVRLLLLYAVFNDKKESVRLAAMKSLTSQIHRPEVQGAFFLALLEKPTAFFSRDAALRPLWGEARRTRLASEE